MLIPILASETILIINSQMKIRLHQLTKLMEVVTSIQTKRYYPTEKKFGKKVWVIISGVGIQIASHVLSLGVENGRVPARSSEADAPTSS